MKIIRTQAVELTSIPAIAYKQKLKAGGAGIKLLRIDHKESAVCTIDKRSADLIPYGTYKEDLFPSEAFDEAFELTQGLPYAARSTIKLEPIAIADEDVAEEAPKDQVDMTLSSEYRAIVERYSDEKGKINYTLMNKDFIQYAAKSKGVADLIAANVDQGELLAWVIKNRASSISGNKEYLDDEAVGLLIETLDEIDPRSAFKELKAHLNRMLTRGKRR